jgi:hypothetical protein
MGVIEDWIERFEVMRLDVQELLLRRHVFRRLQEIVRANPKLHHPSYLYDYLEGTYAASAAVGVRRHARSDEPERDASLIGLLYAIRTQPNLLTRARHVALYKEVGAPSGLAEAEFDRLSEAGAPHLERRHVQPDIDKLREASDRLEKYATKRIAHYEKKEPAEIPKFSELDDALDAFEEIVRRYKLLLLAEGGPIVPVIIEPWERVLTEPWIEKSK